MTDHNKVGNPMRTTIYSVSVMNIGLSDLVTMCRDETSARAAVENYFQQGDASLLPYALSAVGIAFANGKWFARVQGPEGRAVDALIKPISMWEVP